MSNITLFESLLNCFKSSNNKQKIRYVKKEKDKNCYINISNNICDWWKILFSDEIVAFTKTNDQLKDDRLSCFRRNKLDAKIKKNVKKINDQFSSESLFLGLIKGEIEHLDNTIKLAVKVAHSNWNNTLCKLDINDLTQSNIDSFYSVALNDLCVLFFDNPFEILAEKHKWFTDIIGDKSNYCSVGFSNEQILTLYACALLLTLNVERIVQIDENIKNYLKSVFPTEESFSQMIVKYKQKLFEQYRKYELRDRDGPLSIITNTYVMPKFTKESEINTKTSPVEGEVFRSIILGSSGLGKTQFFKMLVVLLSIDACDSNCGLPNETMDKLRTFASEKKMALKLNSAIPVFFEAKSFNNIDIDFDSIRADNFCDIILNNAAVLNSLENDSKEKSRIIDNIKKQKNVVICIDGIDEINPDKRKDCCKAIKDFANDKQDWSIIISSRKIDIPTMYGFQVWGISEFEIQQQKIFIEKICKNFFSKREEKIKFIKETIFSNEYLIKISSNPYFLAHMIAIIFPIESSDNITVKHIYQLIAIKLIETRMTATITRQRFNRDLSNNTGDVEIALSKVAYEIVSNSTADSDKSKLYSLDSETTKSIITNSMRDGIREIVAENIDGFIDLLSHNSGLLVYNGYGFSFINDAFLWYYASKYIQENLIEKTNTTFSEREFADTRGKYINLVWDTIGELVESIDNEAKKQTLIMAFPPKAKRTFITSAYVLLDFLLYKSISTNSKEELNNIAYIFDGLLNNSLLEEHVFSTNPNIKSQMKRIVYLSHNYKED